MFHAWWNLKGGGGGGGGNKIKSMFGKSVSLEEGGRECGEPWRRMLWRCEPTEDHRHLLFHAKKM
jgi:hypothetical protein